MKEGSKEGREKGKEGGRGEREEGRKEINSHNLKNNYQIVTISR
jgi:hypothetical protein